MSPQAEPQAAAIAANIGLLSLADGPIGTRAGEYEITGVLGRGGMGTVFSGTHPIIGTEVAIKVIDPILARDANLVARFIQEARAVNKIRHPNIIDIFAFGDAPDLGHYFVMPLLHGCSLDARIKEHGAMSLSEALPILEQIADALDAVHDKGILHRDLKPENIFLENIPHGASAVRILDFGLAKLTDSDAVATTHGRQQFGTPLFMSPEQWDGAGADRRSDIYALGIVLYYMLTSRFPFESSSPLELMALHVTAEPDPPSKHGASPLADGPVSKALAKKKEQRYAAAGDFYRALKASASQGTAAELAVASTSAPDASLSEALATTLNTPVAAVVHTGKTADEKKAPRSYWPIAALVVALLGAGVWGLFLRNGPEPQGEAHSAAAASEAGPEMASGTQLDAAPAPRLDAGPTMISINLTSEPSKALVRYQGKLLGETPLKVQLPVADSGQLVLERSGYVSQVVVVSLKEDVTRFVELKRMPRTKTGTPPTTNKQDPSEWGKTVDPYR